MLKINDYVVQDFRFPDNTIRLTGEDCEFLRQFADEDLRWDALGGYGGYEDGVEITWHYEDPAEQVTLYFLVKHMRDRLGIRSIALRMLYIPNARMDRTKSLGSEVNTLKYFCEFINSLDFSAVIVMDPHSDASVSMLNRVLVDDTSVKFVQRAVEDSGAKYLFFPDKGAAQRYAPIYNFRPYLVGEKDRDWKTGAIRGLKIENPMDLKVSADDLAKSTILIVDDICSRGGTFLHAGIALQKLGFKNIDLAVTHCEKTIFAGKLLGSDSPIRHIYTTSSIFKGEHDKIFVADLA